MADSITSSSAETLRIEPLVPSNPHQLEIRSSAGKGRGVYATRSIPAGSLVEVSPIVLIPRQEYEQGVQQSELRNYVFSWNWGAGPKGKNGDMALALGLGSMFNHSRQANVSYKLRPDNLTIEYRTTSPVLPDQELCIYYGNVRFGGEGPGDEDACQSLEHVMANWDLSG